MNKFLVSFLVFIVGNFAIAQAADTVFQTDRLLLGKPAAANKSMLFRKSTSSTTQPTVRYNNSNSFMEFSNDGTTFQQFNPMTSGGQTLYGGASGVLSALANGSSGQVLTSAGGTSPPTWTSSSLVTITPYVQQFTSGSATYFLTRVMTLSGATSLTAGWTYTHNAGTCTVEVTTTSSSTVLMSCTTVPTASGTLTCVSCGATGNQTFTAYVSPIWLEVEVVGGGAGGSGAAASPGAGNAGNASSFGTSLLSAAGGNASAGVAAGGAASSTCTLNAPAYGQCIGGGGGGSGTVTLSNNQGGTGGNSCLGGGGAGGVPQGGVGGAAAGNTGGGGGGGAGGGGASNGAGAGGAGVCVRAIVPSPLVNAGYAYVVGAAVAGTAGSASGGAGGSSAAGRVRVTEHFNY